MHKSHRIPDVAQKIYDELKAAGIEVLFDDRKERPGVMFNDMELMGIPHQIVIGERNLDTDQVEHKDRITGEKTLLTIDDAVSFVVNKIKSQ
jgi:prolyl-tRNA synthetase